MSKVFVALAASVDGYITGPNPNPERPLGVGGDQLFDWYRDGVPRFSTPSSTVSVLLSPAVRPTTTPMVGTAKARTRPRLSSCSLTDPLRPGRAARRSWRAGFPTPSRQRRGPLAVGTWH